MENFNIQLHRFHIDTFFETFYESLENRKTYEEKLSYFDFNLLIENQRLNRYLEELQPNLYLDHRLYVDEVRKIVLNLIAEKEAFLNLHNNSGICTYKWEIEKEKLSLLFEKLKGNFISSDTKLETFTLVFSGKPLKEVKEKIVWIKIGRSKSVSKISITDFVEVLLSKQIISKPHQIKKNNEIEILNTLFSSKEGNLKFNNANFVTPTVKSQYREELEAVINSIL